MLNDSGGQNVLNRSLAAGDEETRHPKKTQYAFVRFLSIFFFCLFRLFFSALSSNTRLSHWCRKVLLPIPFFVTRLRPFLPWGSTSSFHAVRAGPPLSRVYNIPTAGHTAVNFDSDLLSSLVLTHSSLWLSIVVLARHYSLVTSLLVWCRDCQYCISLLNPLLLWSSIFHYSCQPVCRRNHR